MALKFQQDMMDRLESGEVGDLGLDQTFSFFCQDGCMGRCCQKITIVLDPWDVELMSRYLEMPCKDFLEQFCSIDFDPVSGWPFARLRHAQEGVCAFMLEGGRCKIYPARSRNCRTYPLGRAVRVGGDGELAEKFFLADRQKFCFGYSSDKAWTVREWMEDSGAQKFFELSDLHIRLVNYAATVLESGRWLSPVVARVLMPLLFSPDILRAKFNISEQVDPEEFYRRRLEALKMVLEEMAGGFGFGPRAGKVSSEGGSLSALIGKALCGV